MFRMLLKCVRRGHGQRPDCDRSSHEEESFVHHDAQSDAQTNQQRHACRINAPVISSDCLHDIPFANENMTARAQSRSA
jgi:hypothetical protein